MTQTTTATPATAAGISVVDYLPTPDLDSDLADLGHAAVRGWPDQGPVTVSLVRSTLRPTGTAATTLALHRDADGALVGAAALKWPATLESPGCLFGPFVHPSAQRGGLGSALLRSLGDVVAARPGIRVVSAEIPETRQAGWELYERAGWQRTGRANLLIRDLPADSTVETTVEVRQARAGEYLDPALAALFATCRPHLGHATARDTYTRWTTDERYDPEGLLLVDGPQGLRAAALVYPVTHNRHGEPHEALLADILTCVGLDSTEGAAVRAALIQAALKVGADLGAAVARAVVDDPELTQTLVSAGFEMVDEIRYYGLGAD